MAVFTQFEQCVVWLLGLQTAAAFFLVFFVQSIFICKIFSDRG